MRIIVTGATGFVGRSLVKELYLQNHDVIALVRDAKKVPDDWTDEIRIVVCPLEELSQYNILGEDLKADILFHFGWEATSGIDRGNVDLQLRNVMYTKEAVMLAKRCECSRFVFAGSIMEYEAMQYLPDALAKPKLGYIYSTSKLTADFMAKTLAQNCGMEYINVVISNIYGPGENSARFLNTLVRKMRVNENIPLTEGTQPYDFIYITDAVKAIVMAGCNGRNNNSYYIGNENQRPLREYIEEAKLMISSNSCLEFGAIPYHGPFLNYQELDTGKMYREFNFRPQMSFKEGIKRLE